MIHATMMKRSKMMSGWVAAKALLCFALFSILPSGCAPLFWAAEKPHIDIAGIVPKEMRLLEQTFLIELRIQNPAETDLDITGLAFDLEINGQPFARGVSNQSVKVERLNTKIIQVTAYTGLSSILRQISEARKGGYALGFTSRLKSSMFSCSSFLRIPFDETGEFK